MDAPKLTVAIPTRNRAELLKRSIASVLSQTWGNYELLVIDNASTDDTASTVFALDDARVRYERNDSDLGIIGNWNRAIELAQGEYLNIFHDDDIMYPTFLERSVAALDAHPTIGFTFPLARRVDINGQFLSMWCENYNRSGLIPGIEYIEMTIDRERCISIAPSMVFRRSVHEHVGQYQQVYGFNTFDFNMWFKIAFNYDVYHIDEVLFDYTIHVDQMSERHWRTTESPSGPIGMAIEVIDALARLLDQPYSEDPEKRKFLSRKLLSLDHKLTDWITRAIPDL